MGLNRADQCAAGILDNDDERRRRAKYPQIATRRRAIHWVMILGIDRQGRARRMSWSCGLLYLSIATETLFLFIRPSSPFPSYFVYHSTRHDPMAVIHPKPEE